MASIITWPGLPGGPITFSFPFSTQYIVPASRTLNRPGIKARRPRKPVQHENGNEDAYAKQDAVYLYNGAGGRQASWHATVDHMEGFADLPADEVGWHAGDGAGDGNYAGFAIELSQRSLRQGGQVALDAIDHAAETMGRVMARLDGSTDWGQHAWYMLKNCPQYLRGNATWWARYRERATFFYNDERRRMAGGVPAGAFKLGARVEVIADQLNVRTGYGLAYRVLTTLPAGAKATVIADNTRTFTTTADGYAWLNLRIDGFGTGWVATGIEGDPWLREIAAPTPAPAPVTYAPKSPIPELLETNLNLEDVYNTVVAVQTVAEIDFIFVADVIEFKRTSKAQQYAGDGGKEVKAPYQEGDRAVAAWITQVADGTYWYLLAGGDDEWIRVKVADTVRIADAPLLGDDMH